MEIMQARRRSPDRLAMLALSELVMVVPAVLFVGAAVMLPLAGPGRLVHVSWIVVGWFAHVPRLGLALLVLGLPCAAVSIGTVILLQTWGTDAGLRSDLSVGFAIVRRQVAPLLVALSTLLAGALAAVLLAHVILN